jgi:hypothetical protein
MAPAGLSPWCPRGQVTKADEIREALTGRPVVPQAALWLKRFDALPAPGEGDIVYPTLMTIEAYWLFQKHYTDTPMTFAHDMKVMGFKKGIVEIRGLRRLVYKMAEAPALAVLKAHRADPRPADFRPKFDLAEARALYTSRSPAVGSNWSPW